MSTPPTLTLRAALHCVNLGLQVVPLHSPLLTGSNVSCTCGKEDCRDIGKHPIYIPGICESGCKSPISNATKVRSIWSQFPYANLGLCVGLDSGFFVIDVDPRSGGDESFSRLCLEVGEALPSNLVVLTGSYGASRGRHIYLALPGGVDLRYELEGFPGIQVKSRGYVVSPPSMHLSGVAYEPVDAAEFHQFLPLLPADAWITLLAREAEPVHEGKTPTNTTIEFPTNKTEKRNDSAVRLVGKPESPLLNQPWVLELLWERLAIGRKPWGSASFSRGSSFAHAKKLVGHLLRYAAEIEEVRQIAKYVVNIAVKHSRYSCKRKPYLFVKLVIGLYSTRLDAQSKDPIQDWGLWRTGKEIIFHTDFLGELKRTKERYACILYAALSLAELNPSGEADMPYSLLRSWSTLVTGKIQTNWVVTEVFRKYSNPTRKRPAIFELVSRGNYTGSSAGYTGGGPTGDRYRIRQYWDSGATITPRQIEDEMGWPSFYEFMKGWLQKDVALINSSAKGQGKGPKVDDLHA